MSAASDPLARVKSVTVVRGGAPFTLDVVWAGGERTRVDLTGPVHRSRHFKAFLDSPPAFRKVQVCDYGGGVTWNNGVDYAADTLRTMAEESAP